VVTEASFETLPIGSGASRRAIAHWSDGTHSEVLRWHSDAGVIPSRPRRAAVRGVERGEFRVMSMFMTSNPRRA
jgi:hypothetical protein